MHLVMTNPLHLTTPPLTQHETALTRVWTLACPQNESEANKNKKSGSEWDLPKAITPHATDQQDHSVDNPSRGTYYYEEGKGTLYHARTARKTVNRMAYPCG